jgi:[acyl-carrier-protein] S-malonyltransferase
MSRAWLFPGQGAQAVGMGSDLSAADAGAGELFATADRVLGFPLSQICFAGPEEELRRTAVTQPALLTASVAAARRLEAAGFRPEAVAGHSLGEYSALVVAGALPFEEAVRAVHLRGRFMQEAVPEGVGAMAAIIGLDGEAVAAVCGEAAGSQVVSPANLNAPGQVVIAGHREAVDRAVGLAREQGARKAIPLKVSAPFHCALMEPAARRLAEVLAEIDFADARVPVWTNVDAAPETAAGRLRDALLRQVASPVRWEESLLSLGESGFAEFLEVGPGTVLAGLVKRTLGKTARTLPAGTLEAIRGLETAAS